MAKQYVIVKCEDKDTSVAAIKKEGVLKAMGATISEWINKKSSGKLSTTDKSKDGYVVTASVVSLKGNDKDKPTKLDAKISIVAIGTGSTTGGFTGTGSGSLDGVSKIQADAEALIKDLFDDLMKKAIAKM